MKVNNLSGLDPRFKKILHLLSVCGTFMMIFGVLFTVQIILFGFISSTSKLSIHGVPLSMILFSITSISLIKKFITISSPYKTD